jgi:peptide/nickel transport system substrate-binding protein
MEAMNSAWLLAESETDRIRIAAQMQELAFREMPSIPLGQFFIDTAHRKSITGLVAPRCVPWNVRRA